MKILIIEDDDFFRNFYSTKLAEKGYEVILASDGNEGLVKIKTENPQLILLDIIMPKLDGFEVLKTLQADQRLVSLPVIVFSTLGQEADVAKAKQLGAKDFINKSYFDFDQMFKKIVSYLPPAQ